MKNKKSEIKYIIIVGDGMADYPVKELGNKTPLEYARTPNMDFLARQGKVGLVKTIPDGVPPGSDVANLNVLGYEPAKYYSGRGPLEAASLGIKLGHDETAWRCNLVNIENGMMNDFTAGHITSEEAKKLIKIINNNLQTDKLKFYPGVSYRHIMVSTDIPEGISCVPPHDITGQPIEAYLPKGGGSDAIKDLMFASKEFLSKHKVNVERKAQGKKEANMIWLWGQGKNIAFPSLKERFGLTGGVITAVDLLKGIGKVIGLKSVNVPGATGFIDTAYEAKALHAIDVLKKDNFVFVHVESPDEAGHMGDVNLKVRAIEDFDQKVVGTILSKIGAFEKVRILLLPDHYTPVSLKTHSSEPVPFIIYGQGIEPDKFESFNERNSKDSDLIVEQGWKLIELLVGG
ncbi:MAG: cofactor-independent phosphoglycerate mutase [bacterium]|nr:cofactor-independent phosphoglycerate mutase [bacterium]